jgi:hypothetical protein
MQRQTFGLDELDEYELLRVKNYIFSKVHELEQLRETIDILERQKVDKATQVNFEPNNEEAEEEISHIAIPDEDTLLLYI